MLLHGLASQRRFWNLVIPHLGGFPLLAVDQRGHGESDQPSGHYALAQVAADLPVALDAIGWSRAVLVGHSWGASVAATFAATHPERTLALVLIDGGFLGPAPQHVDRTALRKQLEPPRIALPPDELEAMLATRSPRPWSSEVAAAVLPIFGVGADGLARARLPFDAHMQILDTLFDYDAIATLSRVPVAPWVAVCETPGTEVAWQQRRDAALTRLGEMRSDVRVHRWGGAVHDVPLQWPALVAGLIRTAAEEAATPRA